MKVSSKSSSKKQHLLSATSDETLKKRSVRVADQHSQDPVSPLRGDLRGNKHLESEVAAHELRLRKSADSAQPQPADPAQDATPGASGFATASVLDPELATRELIQPVFPKKYEWLQKLFQQLEAELESEIFLQRRDELIRSKNYTKESALKALQKGNEPILLQRRLRVRTFEKLWIENISLREVIESAWLEILKMDIYADLEPTKEFVALRLQRLRETQGNYSSHELFRDKGKYSQSTSFSQPLWSTKRSSKELVSHVLSMMAYKHLDINLDAVQEQADKQLENHLGALRNSSLHNVPKKK